MINIHTLASSSAGNAHMVDDGETRLLLDAGLQFRLLRQKLNFQLSGISGVLVGHSHLDHCRAAPDLIKAGIDVYLGKPTADEIDVSGHRVHIVEPKKRYKIGTWTVVPFELQHDVYNLGYLLENRAGERLVYITDSFYCKYLIPRPNVIMIECNYALDILNQNVANGTVAPELKNRIIKSHFSLETCKQFLLANDLSKLRQVHLIHLSGDNSDTERFKREIAAICGVPVYVAGE
jgi:phosphoribosyl 1,2-cyclic phosphodiesterase